MSEADADGKTPTDVGSPQSQDVAEKDEALDPPGAGSPVLMSRSHALVVLKSRREEQILDKLLRVQAERDHFATRAAAPAAASCADAGPVVGSA